MKTILRAVYFILAVLALAGCPETSVGPDFGYKCLVLRPADWNGIWKPSGDDEAMRFEVSDAKNGQITISSIPDPKKKSPATDMLMTLRQADKKKEGRLYFATILDKGDLSHSHTPFLVRRLDNGAFIFWTINNEAVAAAIKAGKLNGKVKPDKDGAHSRIDSDPANYRALVRPEFWNWMDPTIARRQCR